MGDFQLRINDTNHEIQLPDDQIARLLLVNEDNEVSQGFTVRAQYTAVREFPGEIWKLLFAGPWLHNSYLNDISPRNVKTYLIVLIVVVTE